MPIDEVGEGSLPAKGVYGICLMRTGRAIDFNLFRPIGWGQLEGDSTGQSKGQSFELLVRAVEEQRIK